MATTCPWPTTLTTGSLTGLVDMSRGLWALSRPRTEWVFEFYYGNPGDVPFMGDWDCDGDLDMLITRQFAPVSLYRNESENRRWLGLQLIGNGQTCNRNAVGTRVTLVNEGGPEQLREVQISNGFSAQGDNRLLFGLGDYRGKVTVAVNWCGQQEPQTLELEAMQYHVITQQPG